MINEIKYDQQNAYLLFQGIIDSIPSWGARYFMEIDLDNCQAEVKTYDDGLRDNFFNQNHLALNRNEIYYFSSDGSL